MKMTLKNRIAQSLEILSNSNFQDSMQTNDKITVYYASAMLGSQLSKYYNNILMNRNAIPNNWTKFRAKSDCKINFAFKKSYIQVVNYLERGYNITPGRVQKLLDILSDGLPIGKKRVSNNIYLRQYLRNLNNMRICCKEMTEAEIYDFSFDMVYDFIDILSLSKATLSLSLLIMYWIQREADLIPLAVACEKNEFHAALESIFGDMDTKREAQKKLRIFMRKLLDSHLRTFINATDADDKKSTSRDRILELIKDNDRLTAKKMASCLGLSVQAVQKQITLLKAEKRLERIGPDKGGHWNVLKN